MALTSGFSLFIHVSLVYSMLNITVFFFSFLSDFKHTNYNSPTFGAYVATQQFIERYLSYDGYVFIPMAVYKRLAPSLKFSTDDILKCFCLSANFPRKQLLTFHETIFGDNLHKLSNLVFQEK